MDRPPPVRFPIGRHPLLAWGLAGSWALALAPALTALALHPPARSHGLALAAALVAAMSGAWLTWRFWRAQTPGELIWNGAEWLLEKDGATAAIEPPGIRCDAQHWLLLRVRADRRALWLWAARAAAPARWHGLRCALYARVFVFEAPV